MAMFDQRNSPPVRQEDDLKNLVRTVQRPTKDATPMMRQIRTLENRLDKAQIKYNEAQSIRKTYDQIVKRLKDERVSFDNQLAAIETTLQAKEQDYEELLLMSHDAAHARDAAKAELTNLQSMIQAERKAREKELTERQNAMKARRELNERMEERERIRREILREASGEADEDAEAALRAKVLANAASSGANASVVQSERAVVGAYEAAFRRIRESTGVSDVNEVIQKFLTQESTRSNLARLTKEAQSRLDSLGNERSATKTAVDEMKYAGGLGPGSRQEIEGAERKHQDIAAAFERVKARHARTTKAFVDVRVGIEHMIDKLEPVRLDRLDGTGNVALSDETIVEVMQQCEAKLLRLAELHASAGGDVGGRGASATTGDNFGDAANGPNLRIHLQVEDQDEEEEDDDDPDGDIPDRMMMKKQHGLLLDKANAKGKRRKKKLEGGKAAPAGKPFLA